MRISLFLLFCALSICSFAQLPTIPSITETSHKLPSLNRPDLKVLSIQLGGIINGRQSLSITIRNNGNKHSLPCVFNAKYTWRPGSKTGLQFFSFSQGIPDIRPYKTISITTAAPEGMTLHNYTPLSGNSLELKIIVDFLNQNLELSEFNNTFMQTFGFSN